ncbi:hypothetical protein BLNAU_21686 [Blattamonas nauphoetae]|uniref:Uncharacterized protein n=1 Tax=Blattamonas nauphoetae TaxID=2049346 RepID=A0ABQ9WY93_9EUKA|nr:hypothetical protein BLNAU_21686 [Blattamonas nauphoetae]
MKSRPSSTNTSALSVPVFAGRADTSQNSQRGIKVDRRETTGHCENDWQINPGNRCSFVPPDPINPFRNSLSTRQRVEKGKSIEPVKLGAHEEVTSLTRPAKRSEVGVDSCAVSPERRQNCPSIPCRVPIQQKVRLAETAQHSVTIKSPTAAPSSIRVPILKPHIRQHPSIWKMHQVCEGVMQESKLSQQPEKHGSNLEFLRQNENAEFPRNRIAPPCHRPAARAEHSINEHARTVNDPTSFHHSAPPCSEVVAEVHQQLMKVWETEREVWVMDGLVVRGCVDGVRETRRDRRVSNEK